MTLSPMSAVMLFMQTEKDGGSSTQVLYERNPGISAEAGSARAERRKASAASARRRCEEEEHLWAVVVAGTAGAEAARKTSSVGILNLGGKRVLLLV